MTDTPALPLTEAQRDALDAAAFRRLLSHLDAHKEVQNIDLMILADFCRNCLGDWWQDAAASQGLDITRDAARERIYSMPYSEWKEKHQQPATDEQMAAFKARQAAKGKG